MKSGIGLFGIDADIQLEVHHSTQYKLSRVALAAITIPSGTVSANVYYADDTAKHAEGTITTFATALENSGSVATATDQTNKIVYVAEDSTYLADTAFMPIKKAGDAVVFPASVIIAGGKGRWPLNRASELENRFLGRYQGMDGVRMELPVLGERYAVLQYVIGGKSSALSSGASSIEEYYTRVDEVLSASAIKGNSNLMTIVKKASL